MAFVARWKLPSVRARVAALSGVMVLGFAVIGAVFQAGRSEVEQALAAQQTYSALAEQAYQFRGRADALKVTAGEWTASRLAHHGQAFIDRHKALVEQLEAMSAASGARPCAGSRPVRRRYRSRSGSPIRGPCPPSRR